MSMRDVPGYPFFPCRICIREGFSGKNNDGCDHAAFERARAAGVNIHSAHPSTLTHRAPLPSDADDMGDGAGGAKGGAE